METPLERMKRKVFKENLWFFILKILKKSPRYSYEVRWIIKERFGFWVGNVTSYKVLYDLHKGGYVTFSIQYNKKLYKITAKGRNQIRKAEAFFKDVVRS